MSLGSLDFEGLSETLLGRAREVLPEFLPGGRIIGQEYTCGSLRGEKGESLKVNIQKGVWKDFATGEGGSDLISLYAAIEGIAQGEAAKRLADRINFSIKPRLTAPAPRQKPPVTQLSAPPQGVPDPDFNHRDYGSPSQTWVYRSQDGAPLFHVARYNPPFRDPDIKKKQIIPFSWNGSRWITKAWPDNRPLYGLDRLHKYPEKPVLIVEGEKAAEAGDFLAGHVYAVITWSGGGKAFKKTDWTPVHGRKVLIWPDADSDGIKTADAVAALLHEHCHEIKVIDVSRITSEGWDAADAVEEGWDYKRLTTWAKPLASVYIPTLEPEVIDPEPTNGHANGHTQNHLTLNVYTNEDEIPVETTKSIYALHESMGLVKTEKGQPICNILNAQRVIEGLPDLKDIAWFDEFYGKYLTKWGSNKVREWDESDDLRLTYLLQSRVGIFRISDDIVSKAVRHYANERKRNEPFDWMETLEWDGVPRIGTFFIDCMGTADNEYTRAVSKNFWISMVARVYRPGCQSDSMVVLEGGQGLGKSSAIREIGGHWSAELNERVDSKDFAQALQGKILLEISELDAFNYAETETIKKVISCPKDRYRPSYGRYTKDFPRRCVFIGTTNQDEYLKDHTGARRFWPLKTQDIDLPMIREIRDQCFAEAVHCFKEGETWHEVPMERALSEQEARRQTDEWEHLIAAFLDGTAEGSGTMFPRDEVKLHEVAKFLGFDSSRLDRGVQMRISKVLKIIGWKKRQVRDGDDRPYVWFRVAPF